METIEVGPLAKRGAVSIVIPIYRSQTTLDELIRRLVATCRSMQRPFEIFSDLETQGKIRRPIVPAHCAHNAHMYYLLVPDLDKRSTFIARLMADGVQAVFHYVPLHDAPAGKRYARSHGKLSVTTEVSERLVRLPMWIGLEPHQQRVIDAAYAAVDW